MSRIVHLTTVHWAHDIRILRKECATLAAAGHEVFLVAQHDRDEEIDGVKVLGMPSPSGRRERMTRSTRAAVGRACGLAPAVCHLHDPELLAWLPQIRRSVPHVVYDMHEDLPRQLLTKDWIPRGLRKATSLAAHAVERVTLTGMPVVAAEDSYVARRPWLRNVRVVRNYPRLDHLSGIPLTEVSGVPLVGYLGTVTEDRGCLEVVAALGILAAESFRVGFECVGPVDPGLKARVETMACARGVSPLRLRGRVEAREGWGLMAGCRLGLALLHPDPNYVDSQPTKVFEYMALGLPVIVSDFPLYRAIVERHDCGVAVAPTDPAAIAAAIRSLIEDPERCRRMGDNGRRAVQATYSWDAEARTLLDLYEELLSGR